MARNRTLLSTIALVALSSIFLVSCMAGGYTTTTKNGHEKVYRNNEDGSKTLVYEIAKDGTPTIYDEADPRAQEIIEAERRAEAARVADEERVARIEAAPKRGPGEPIYVVLNETELDNKLRESQHSEGAVFAELEKHFENDDVIRLVASSAANANEWGQLAKAWKGESTKSAPASDVDVHSKAYLEEKVGINKKTGKVGSMWVLVFEATVSSNYLPITVNVAEEGNVFQNAEVTRRLADKIKRAIKDDIGPKLPADRSL